jgi:hypothetical protein
MIRAFFPDLGSPCPKCGARPDLACSHRPVDDQWTAPEQHDETDGRKLQKDQPRAYGNRTIVSSGGQYRIAIARQAGLQKESQS